MELQTFNFNGQSVRTLIINDEPYFVGKEVADILGYSNSRDALSKHVDEEDKGVAKCDTLGGKQELTVINESGLYSLILSSKLSSAKEFKRWVTSEVLPAIRKHGAYLTDKKAEEIITNKDALAELLLQAGQQLKEKEFLIEQMKPKALFADAVEASDTSILMYDLAKLIKQNGVDIGGNRLWTWMRDKGYIFKHSCEPTQKSMDLKLFEVVERTIQRSGSDPKVTRTTRVTGKGQLYFLNKILGGKDETNN